MQAIPLELLPVFFVIALFHSSVGLAGGTTYAAVLALVGTSLALIPFFSLALNILVSIMAAANYTLQQYLNKKLILACLLGSMPMVVIGAQISLPAFWFYLVLLLMLAIGMLRLAVTPIATAPLRPLTTPTLLGIALLCAVLGFLSGSVGIGGGICLVPLLIFLNIASIKVAAATGAVFILCNSLLGLAVKLWASGLPAQSDLYHLVSLGVMVVLGGLVGSWLGAKKWQPVFMQRILASVMGVAMLLLFKKIVSLP